ncbi:MAG: sensor histidine kinase [Rhodospirillaceae bacterium]
MPQESLSWKPALRIGFLVAAIAVITLLHMTTAPAHAGRHAVYEYLYYLPIIAAAAWYGAPGGVLAAVVVSVAYLPLVEMTWPNNAPYVASQLGQVLAYHMVGGSVGYLMQRQRRLAGRYRSAAAALEIRNRELQASHEQLRQAERLSTLGEIAAGLAHELRNPIAAVSAAMDIVGRNARDGTPEAEFGSVARRELARVTALLDEFLSFARPQPPHLRPAPLRPLLDHVAILLQNAAQGRAVAVTVDPAAAGDAVVDAGQITQVLLNVVLNAIQATPAGGAVTMKSHVSPEWVTLFVDDDGAGIAPEDRPRVFDPFFTTKPHGTGLGLAVAQRILSAHGGTMELEPRNPAGTRAVIRLPRAARRPGEAHARGASA